MFVMWLPPDSIAYSHLLGLYLGDGWIWSTGRTYGLRLALDAQYPQIVRGAVTSVEATELPRSVAVRDRSGAVIVTAYSRLWPQAFPQHGPGRKHQRLIVLEPWQREIVDAHPGEFVRGLIESERLPLRQPLLDAAAEWAGRRLRVRALLLLEPLRGHPRAVLRGVRPARRCLDAVQCAQHLGLPARERGAAGRARGAEALISACRSQTAAARRPRTRG